MFTTLYTKSSTTLRFYSPSERFFNAYILYLVSTRTSIYVGCTFYLYYLIIINLHAKLEKKYILGKVSTKNIIFGKWHIIISKVVQKIISEKETLVKIFCKFIANLSLIYSSLLVFYNFITGIKRWFYHFIAVPIFRNTMFLCKKEQKWIFFSPSFPSLVNTGYSVWYW